MDGSRSLPGTGVFRIYSAAVSAPRKRAPPCGRSGTACDLAGETAVGSHAHWCLRGRTRTSPAECRAARVPHALCNRRSHPLQGFANPVRSRVRSGDSVFLSGARELFGDHESGAAGRTARLQDAHVGAVETAGWPEESGALAGAGRTLATGGRVARIALPRRGGGESDGGVGGEKGNLSLPESKILLRAPRIFCPM